MFKLLNLIFDFHNCSRARRLALEHGRKLVVSKKDAYLLRELAGTGLDIPEIDCEDLLIYVDRRRTGRYDEKDYYGWERPFLHMPNAVDGDFVHGNQDGLMVHLDFFDVNEIIDMKPNPGSVYIHSTSEPHNEEQRIDEERLDNWLRRFDMPRLHAHASGHANYLDLMRIVREIKPKKLIPIHTEHPELFKLIHDNVEPPKLNKV